MSAERPTDLSEPVARTLYDALVKAVSHTERLAQLTAITNGDDPRDLDAVFRHCPSWVRPAVDALRAAHGLGPREAKRS